MEKEWAELSPEAKREERFKSWLNPEDINFNSPEAEENYKARVGRIIAAIKLEEPDRVPVICHPGYAPAFYSGFTVKEVMYDSEKLLKAWFKYMDDFDLDVLPDANLIRSGEAMEIIGVKTSKWAGHGLPDNVAPQHVEIEVLKAEEWDHFENDASDFNLRVMLPRTHEAAEPFAALAFKIATDPFVGRLAFIRVYSGSLDSSSYVLNNRTGRKERISRLMQMHSNKQNPIDIDAILASFVLT